MESGYRHNRDEVSCAKLTGLRLTSAPFGPLILLECDNTAWSWRKEGTENSMCEICPEVGIVGSDTLQFLPSCHRIIPPPDADVHEGQDLIWNNLLGVGLDSFLQSIERQIQFSGS